ncbi:DUF4145 domain-containing protein [Colwellia sp. PAMC 21821]|uniref:DUF4145 domain-containing protein n=1 Tax=Colwellia sp. PAMC 21821 TaxID=1816219 RepID=UPI0009BFDD2F|nr:DUF4145 domain-containing protein [Colwellia sp. PAMC 21821]ARD44446.1 hypothetical protein A3Q33_09085 [Colwellia sp. PAMC 21821]
MNTDKWKSILGFVALDKYPNLPCPYCHQETLNIDESSLVSREVSEKYKQMASRHFNLENDKQKVKGIAQEKLIGKMLESNSLLGVCGAIGYAIYQVAKPSYHFCKFTAFMACASCNDNVAVTGLSQEHTKKTTNETQLPALYKVEQFSIPVPMFEISLEVPVSIQFELLGAFSYFHIDTNLSASKLRRGIEKYCSELGMKPNTLARQIKELETKYPIEANFLNTLRLVGNEGTHSDGVDEDDLLQAFNIVEEILAIFPRLAKLERLKEPQAHLEEKFDKKKARTETKTLEHEK